MTDERGGPAARNNDLKAADDVRTSHNASAFHAQRVFFLTVCASAPVKMVLRAKGAFQGHTGSRDLAHAPR